MPVRVYLLRFRVTRVDLPLQASHVAIGGGKSGSREHSWARGVASIVRTPRQAFLGSGPSHVAVEREG